jgi:RimJ/RimL family protein N-acetyltransferase
MTDDEIRTPRAKVPQAGTELHGDSVVLRPVAPADVPELGRIARTPEVESRWGDEYLNEDWPLDDPSATPLVVLVEGRVVGMIQYSEENDAKYRHAGIDIFLDPAMHGRGHGRDAVRTLTRHLVRYLGHHRLVIDPAADNEPAIRSYSAVGFRPVGIMRRYERDAGGSGWHDGLLMDLLAEELA